MKGQRRGGRNERKEERGREEGGAGGMRGGGRRGAGTNGSRRKQKCVNASIGSTGGREGLLCFVSFPVREFSRET